MESDGWIKTEDRTPDKDMQCIVSRSGYQTEMLVWNSHYNVWDDADGDDYCCDSKDVKYWIAVPTAPLQKGE